MHIFLKNQQPVETLRRRVRKIDKHPGGIPLLAGVNQHTIANIHVMCMDANIFGCLGERYCFSTIRNIF